MRAISFFSYEDPLRKTLWGCNRKSTLEPLMVNCVGVTNYYIPFQTENKIGRKDYYFLYLYKGNLLLTTDGKTVPICEGTLVLIPPDTPYTYSSKDHNEMIYYWIHFTGSHAMQKLVGYQLTPPLIRKIPKIASTVEKQLLKMMDIYLKNDPFRDAELSFRLDEILLQIAKSETVSDHSYEKIRHSVRYINANYTSDIKIPDLAKMELLSVSYYKTLFKNAMGISPGQYIIQLRIDAACDLLTNSEFNIAQIASMLGFKDCYFFSRLFKKRMNQSPLKYRKETSSIQEKE